MDAITTAIVAICLTIVVTAAVAFSLGWVLTMDRPPWERRGGTPRSQSRRRRGGRPSDDADEGESWPT